MRGDLSVDHVRGICMMATMENEEDFCPFADLERRELTHICCRFAYCPRADTKKSIVCGNPTRTCL